MSISEHPSIADLQKIATFQDLEPEQLEWLAAHMSNEQFASGDLLSRAGDPADKLVVVFEGEMQARREDMGPDPPIYIVPAGRVTGKLPFSRMKAFPATVRVVGATRLGRMHESFFPEMFQVIPGMGERLVGVLADRIREVAKVDQNRDKLAAIGKLSAGLAHELNNPASAALRSASNLREALSQLADSNRRLATCPLGDAARESLAEFERELTESVDNKPVLDTIAQNDREEELIEWLDKHGIRNGWEFAPALTDTGVDIECLNHLLEIIDAKVLGSALRRIAATFNVERLLREIENSTNRISVLVRAVKEYSYMDRTPDAEVDLHRGLDVTLTMLNHVLKHGITVTREYDSSIPKVPANGSELNQVWTNLIDNAISAMGGKGTLDIRTARENDMVLVEITDSGPGIPPSIQDRIFEPFFTTKGVGEGTGLGLDFVYRIVSRHRGDVRFTSRPGETRFQVRLPLTAPAHHSEERTDEHEPVHAHQSNS